MKGYEVTVRYFIRAEDMVEESPEDAEFIILHNPGQPGITSEVVGVKKVA